MAVSISNTFAGAGGGGGGGHVAPNSLFSNADLRVLDLISEGQIGGLVDGAKSIYFDDVPLQNKSGSFNYDNVQIDWVNGTPDQKIIEGFNDVVTPQVVGTEVKNGLPVTAAIESTEADKVKVTVSLPNLYSQDKKGNINPTSVDIRFELSTNDTGNWKQLGDFTIKGKQNSQYERSYTFDLPQVDDNNNKANKWLIRMSRLSQDSHERYSARTTFDTLYVITNSRLNYPHSALVGIRVNAKNLSSIPTRSYLVDGMIIQIPSNYDPKTNKYEGIWDGTFKMAVSDNPAWILYALLTNKRWGLGEFIAPENVNKAKLYEIGRYCDEEIDNGYGKKEKRFSINTQIQERSDAYRLISDIAAVFRGMAFWAGGLANFTCDMPTDATMLYTPANVVGGNFTYQGSARSDRHSVALVTWNDPEQNYKQVVEYVEDADLIRRWGIRQAELTAFGCTSRAQAIRAGRWILYTESYESDIISFDVGLDSALVLPGDVIKIQDPSYSGKRLGGRLVKITENSATLDSEVDLTTGGDTTISIMMPDGTFVERNVIVSYSGKRTFVEWNTPLEKLPTANAIWIISESNLVPQIARVVNIEQGEQKGTYKITAVSHQPKKFDLIEKGIQFTEDQTSITDPLNIEAPTKPNVSEVTSSLGLGYISSVLNVTWIAGRGCASYELLWRRENENESDWVTVTTQQKFAQITDVLRGTYHFVLRGIGLLGTKTEDVEFFYTAQGQYVTPLDVTDFEVIKRPSYLEVRWKPVEAAYAYEVRCGTTWDDAEVLITSFAGTTFNHYQYYAGTYYYMIRSISSTGDYSPNVTVYKLVLTAPAMPKDLVAIISGNRIDFKWKANTEDDLSHYELREGQNWESGVKVAESKVSQMTVPSGSKAERKFWLKAIALPKIYSEEAAWCVVNVQDDLGRNIVLQHNARTFGWNSNKVYMEKKSDDLQMIDGVKHSEYIAKIALASKLTTQNSFFVSVSTVVKATDDKLTWKEALFAWNSMDAQRSWRLGGDASTIEYEQQIAREVGQMNEHEGWSLEETLDSERGVKPTIATGVEWDWGRYTKGLKIMDLASYEWHAKNLSQTENGKFKFSFWLKTQEPDQNQTYVILRMGNENDNFAISYNSSDKKYRLETLRGEILSANVPMLNDQHVFIGVSQTETERTFVVGILGGDVVISNGQYKPIGNMDYLQLGNSVI